MTKEWIIECFSDKGMWVTSFHTDSHDGVWVNMSFEKVIEILSCPPILSANMHYRGRNTKTQEVIPADIFG